MIKKNIKNILWLFLILIFLINFSGFAKSKEIGEITKVSSNQKRFIISAGEDDGLEQGKEVYVVNDDEEKIAKAEIIKLTSTNSLIEVSEKYSKKKIKQGFKVKEISKKEDTEFEDELNNDDNSGGDDFDDEFNKEEKEDNDEYASNDDFGDHDYDDDEDAPKKERKKSRHSIFKEETHPSTNLSIMFGTYFFWFSGFSFGAPFAIKLSNGLISNFNNPLYFEIGPTFYLWNEDLFGGNYRFIGLGARTDFRWDLELAKDLDLFILLGFHHRFFDYTMTSYLDSEVGSKDLYYSWYTVFKLGIFYHFSESVALRLESGWGLLFGLGLTFKF